MTVVSHSLMIIDSLDIKKGPFSPRETSEDLFDPGKSYLSIIGVFMYYKVLIFINFLAS